MSEDTWEQEVRWHHYTAAMQIAAKLPQDTEAAIRTLELAKAITLDLKSFRETGEVPRATVSSRS